MPPTKRNHLRAIPRAAAKPSPPAVALLPHERDETAAAPEPPQPVMQPAQRDVDRGLVDTDCYTRLGKLPSRGTKP